MDNQLIDTGVCNNISTELSLLDSILPDELYDSDLKPCETLKQLRKMRERKQLIKKYDDRIKKRGDGRLYYITINRKQIAAKTIDGLYDKLWKLEYGIQNRTLNDIYPDFIIYRRDHTAVSTKTLKETGYVYNAFYRDDEIANIPVKDITTKMIKNFFMKITCKRALTKKKFMNVKSVLSKLMEYALDIELITSNPLLNIGSTNQFPFKPVNHSDKVYTVEERAMIMNYLKDSTDIYDLAILLDFTFTLRIGELLSLKYSDIEGSYLHVQRTLVIQNEINDDLTYGKRRIVAVDHIKGYSDEGFRYLPIPPSAFEIIERIKSLGIGSEYIFQSNGTFLLTDTFNEHLRKIAKALNIEYKSSHKIRFCTASMLFAGNVSMADLQRGLGHTNLNTTLHYVRRVTPSDDYAKKVSEIL